MLKRHRFYIQLALEYVIPMFAHLKYYLFLQSHVNIFNRRTFFRRDRNPILCNNIGRQVVEIYWRLVRSGWNGERRLIDCKIGAPVTCP